MILSSLVLSGVAAVPFPTLAVQETTGGDSIPVPRRALPADTAFVLHFDLRTFFGSSWWGAMGNLDEVSQALGQIEELEQMKQEFGIDPFEDLLSITVLGRDDKGDGAAVILRGSARAEQAIEAVRGMEGRASQSVGDLPVDVWQNGSDSIAASFHATPEGERLAILAESPEDVARVVFAAAGDQPRLASAERPAIDARARDGAFFYLEVGMPLGKVLEGSPVAPFANEVKNLKIQLGEVDEEIFVQLDVLANGARHAEKLSELVDGARSLVAMSGMLQDVPPAMVELWESLDAELDGDRVKIGFQIPASDLAYMVEELQELAGN